MAQKKKKPTKAAPKKVTKKASLAKQAITAPVDRKKLKTEEQREKALDDLGAWIVEALASAGTDKKNAKAIIEDAIKTFYDIREAAEQERGEYAGHFFMVDAVGIDDTDRPVPWQVLAKRVPEEAITMYNEIFDKAEREVR
jgi:hypothetical protein